MPTPGHRHICHVCANIHRLMSGASGRRPSSSHGGPGRPAPTAHGAQAMPRGVPGPDLGGGLGRGPPGAARVPPPRGAPADEGSWACLPPAHVAPRGPRAGAGEDTAVAMTRV